MALAGIANVSANVSLVWWKGGSKVALNFNMMGLGFHFFVQDDATLGLRQIDQTFKNVSADAEEMYYKTKTSLDQMESKFGALGDARVQSALQKVGMTMVGLGTATLFGLGKAIKSYSEFEQEMLNAQAVAGWTQETFQDLSNFAIQVGASTRFTSTQVAEALYEFSSAGVTATDSIKELTSAAAGFAAAGNLQNLGDAARSIISAVAGFQLPMTETAHVADVFTKAVQQSMIYAEDFNLAIGRFAGTAGTAGQSLESALTAFMAARKIIGSAEDAATSVARAFQVLSAPPSAEAFRLMGENFLDLDLWDKTTGRMKQWPEIVRELEATFKGIDPIVRQFASFAGQSDAQLKALAETYGLTAEQVRGLTEAARNGTKAFEAYTISELFGSDAIRAVQASLNAEVDAMINGRTVTLRGADALEYWQRTLEDSAGTAQAAAKIQMSGLTGAFLELEGAIDSAQKTLGRQFEGPILKLATGLTSLVNIFNEMPASMQKTIAYGLALGGIGAILGGMGFLFLAQLPGFLTGLKALRDAHIGLKIVTLASRGATLAYHGAILLARGATMVWTGAQWGLNAALTAAQWSVRTAGLLAYRGAMLLAQGATLAWTGFQWALNMALGGLQLAGRAVALGVYYGAIISVRGATLAWTGAQWLLNAALTANPIGLVIAAIAGLSVGIVLLVRNWEKVTATIGGWWSKLTGWFSGMPAWGQYLLAIFMPVIGLPLLIVEHWEGIKTWFAGLPGAIAGFINAIPGFLSKLFLEDIPYWIGYGIGYMVRLVWEGVEAIVGFFASLPGRVVAFVVNLATQIPVWWAQIRDTGIQIIGQGIETIITFFAELPGRIWAFLVTVPGTILNIGAELWSAARQAGSQAVNGMVDIVSGLPGQIWDILTDVAENLINFGPRLWEAAKKAAGKLWEGFKEGLGIHSPSYIEQAMTNILWTSREATRQVETDFERLSGLAAQPTITMATTYESPEPAGAPALKIAAQEALTGVWNWIAGVFNLSDQARQWGVNLITGFVEGVESAYDKLKQGLTDAAGWIKKFLGFGSPTELGPGKYADQWAPDMVKMFAGGLRAGLPEVTAAATDMAEAVSRAIVIRPIFQEAGQAARLAASAEVPPVPSLQGAVNYQGVLGGLPDVPGLEGQMLYRPSLAEVPPVPSLEGMALYHAALGPLPEAPEWAGQLTYQPVAGRPEMWGEQPPTVTRPEPMPVHMPLPQPPPIPAPVAGQERGAVTGTMSKVAETIRQPIQLVLDGRVLAEIIANIQAENDARAGAY